MVCSPYTLITDALFWRAAFAEYNSDIFQNIDHQYTVGTGIGYQIIDTNRVEWGIVSGPAYQETRYLSVDTTTDPTAKEKNGSAAFFTATNVNIEVSGGIDFYYDYSFFYSVKMLENTATIWLQV